MIRVVVIQRNLSTQTKCQWPIDRTYPTVRFGVTIITSGGMLIVGAYLIGSPGSITTIPRVVGRYIIVVYQCRPNYRGCHRTLQILSPRLKSVQQKSINRRVTYLKQFCRKN